jgi:3,4-dehydroadipyl-CoA semialdehyde dehydrogenase
MSEIVRIRSYVASRWVEGTDEGVPLVNPTTGAVVATASTAGLELGAALSHARAEGGRSLRELGFEGRSGLLKGLSRLLREHRDELLDLSTSNLGATRADGAFDVDGASGTLSFYALLGRSLGSGNLLPDGEGIALGRDNPLWGRHVWVPRRGVAVLVNAFNFPAWGFAEKMACAFLAGMPVVVKPATATALVAYRISELFVDSELLPAGSWTFLAGPAGDLLDHLESQDVLAFTGSAATAAKLRSHPRVLAKGVRVNVEADSLNAAVLGPGVEPGSATWQLFVRETVHEMTHKAGQKCTATRRIFVPARQLESAQEALTAALSEVRVGDPADREVTMGPVVDHRQLEDVRRGIEELAAQAEIVFGSSREVTVHGSAQTARGAFVGPVLLRADDPRRAEVVHRREVFGPVATVMPYDGTAEDAAELVGLGEGSLVSTVYSDDPGFVRAAVAALAPFNGRLVVGSASVAGCSWGPGTVLPGLVHGGPGRAGAGEELGGVRGVRRYLQRVAVEGDRGLVEAALADAEE